MDNPAFRRKATPANAADPRRDIVRIDGDISSRIRSLLASHGEKRPPTTPCPTPAGERTAANSDDEVGVSSSRADYGAAHAKLSFLRKANPDLFAHNYDGPAGEAPDYAAAGPRRRSTQRGLSEGLRSEGDGQSISTTEKALTTSDFSRSRHSLREPPRKPDADGPRRVRSTLSKPPAKPRQSLFNLKAKPSADSQLADRQSNQTAKEAKFRINHVPGSFRSEYDASIRTSRTSSTTSVKESAPATIEPPQGRSFDAVSILGPSNNEGFSLNQASGQPPAEPTRIERNRDEVRPDAAIPFLRPMLSNSTIRETPSITAFQADPAAQPTSLQSVIDSFEGQPPDSDLIQAVEATSNQALTPDLGPKSAVAAVYLQKAAVLSSLPVADKDIDAPKAHASSYTATKATGAVADRNLGPYGEQCQGLHAPMAGGSDTKDSPAKRAVREVSPSPIPDENETQDLSQTLGTASQSSPSSQQPVHPQTDTNANWMRQLLGRKSAPAIGQAPPNLTARPHHRSRKVIEDMNLPRSETVPVQGNRVPTESDAPRGPESFTRVITDLEGLLQQALQIAGHANGQSAVDGISSKRISRSPTFRSARQDVEARETSYESLSSGDEDTSDSPGLDEEQNRTTVPLRYAARNGGRITLVEPDETDRYHGQFKNHRHATPYPSDSRVASMNPDKAQEELLNKSNGREWSNTLAVPGQRTISADTDSAPSQQPFQVQADLTDGQDLLLRPAGATSSSVDTADWAVKRQPTTASRRYPEPTEAHHAPSPVHQPAEDAQSFVLRERRPSKTAAPAEPANVSVYSGPKSFSSGDDQEPIAYLLDRPAGELHKRNAPQRKNAGAGQATAPGAKPLEDTLSPLPSDFGGRGPGSDPKSLDLKHRHHFSIREPKMFSLDRSHKRSPIARDWSISKKRWVALVACINTALMGLIIGIYAGEVPAIQYNIVDEHHYTILGNVVLFVGLAITTSIFWPLPLLYGRKPFTLAALAILVPLQFPQAVAVSGFRTPYTPTYRVALLLSRALAGLVMGFANINFIATLLDLFGASLQSVNPHQEIVNVNDVRRHGGGMGIWLGVWTWCFIGSIGVGFFIGAVIISGLAVDWGFWITIIVTAFVLVLNVLVPEVRRSPYRRSVAEVRTPTELSRRVARGEVKMHLYSTGPKWWIEEVIAGSVLCVRMLKQPGFLVLSTYVGWIYGQIVMVIVVCHQHQLQTSVPC